MKHKFCTVYVAHKQVTSSSFFFFELFENDTAFGYISIDILDIYITIWIQILQSGYQQRIEDQIITFWNPLGRHFVYSLRESIHEVLTCSIYKKIYMSKNCVTYIHRTVWKWHSIRIYIYWHFGHIYYNLDTNIAIWIYILQFGQIYCNLDINMETRHIHMTFQHIDPVWQAYNWEWPRWETTLLLIEWNCYL